MRRLRVIWAIFVSASHQTGLDIKSFLYWRFREGKDVCWSSAHLVQSKPDETIARQGLTRYITWARHICLLIAWTGPENLVLWKAYQWRHRLPADCPAETESLSVLDLSSVEIFNLEHTILAHGLDHCILSSIIKREEIFSEFEVLFTQLRRLQPVSTDSVSDVKARLNDLAHAYAGTPVSSWESSWRGVHYRTLKALCNNDSIVITRPDKGSGVVILDHQSYVDKMMVILSDTSKFLRLGPADNFDHTASIETKFQRRLVELVKKVFPSSTIGDQIRPTGSIRPRLYGLPKPIRRGFCSDQYYL